ncbi:MAG: methyltransferase [Holosporaceae bacterium]|jgi:tRNA1(Val) A37 N6-methylase TrmN6|nr:methyltransferase [Holosporaceae bacterium]
METSEDTILNGRIKLLQPKNGYRVAVDPIILAYFVDSFPEQKVLDVGCGAGTVSLILKMREKLTKITAIDLDEKMCHICRQNSQKNLLNIDVINVDIKHFSEKSFDQVVTNPPFFEEQFFRTSALQRLAKFETISISEWIKSCFQALKPRGVFTMIHRAVRIGDILYALKLVKAGGTVIVPIYSKENQEAKRIVVRSIKGSKAEPKILPGLLIHKTDGTYSDMMQKILSGEIK